MRTKFYLLIVFVVAGYFADAQAVLFSQYYASPLTLNPALTGKFDGFARVDGIYRGQYYGLSQSSSIFRTPAISADFSLLKDKMNGNALGIGLSVVNDQQTSTGADPSGNGTSQGKIGNTTIALDLGYTLNLNKKKTIQLSVGLEPSIGMRNTTGSYEYPQAFNSDLSYDVTSPNNESISSPKKTYFNFAYGLFFNHQALDWLTYYIGFAMDNVARPQTAVISTNNANGKLPFLYVVHGGFEFKVAKKWTLIPGVLYQSAAKANEANAGITAGYDVIDKDKNGIRRKATIYLGIWDRMGNDVGSAFQERNITPKIGFDYMRFRVDFAYDISVGNIATDAHPVPGVYRPQAYELAISYIFGGPKPLKEREYLFNPRY
jgi:type IX secretion system PorP/SprF family membrane protein